MPARAGRHRPRRRDSSLRERLGQRVFVDDTAAGGVDDDCLRLELGNRLSIQQVKRLGVLRHVERHDVGGPQERLVVDRSRAQFGEALGRDVRIVGEYAHLERRSRRATCDPTRPRPTMPTVRPRRSIGRICLRCHRPARVETSAGTIWRVTASSSAMVCSPPRSAFAPGALSTSTPARVAASKSILSTPTPARATTRKFRAARENLFGDLSLTADDECVGVTHGLEQRRDIHAVDVDDLAPRRRVDRARPGGSRR